MTPPLGEPVPSIEQFGAEFGRQVERPRPFEAVLLELVAQLPFVPVICVEVLLPPVEELLPQLYAFTTLKFVVGIAIIAFDFQIDRLPCPVIRWPIIRYATAFLNMI
jgi:hypothetical protein